MKKETQQLEFSQEQTERYSRHLLLKDLGPKGLKKILTAKVLVVGTGGLGSAILYYLGAAGVGTIGIADGDVVDRTNLQRQIIHFSDDLGRPKVLSAKEKINRINPDVVTKIHDEMITARNIMAIIDGYDMVVDATDNFTSKYLINDACVLAEKPFSHASVIQFVGQLMTIIPGQSACYRCFFPEPPPPGAVPSAGEVGVLGAVVGTVGTLQATEVIKFVTDSGKLLLNRLLVIDSLDMTFKRIQIQKQKNCPACGSHPTLTASNFL